MANSVIQEKGAAQTQDMCYLCHKPIYNNRDLHHIFNGSAYRKKSDEDGFVVYLHHTCHMWLHEHPVYIQHFDFTEDDFVEAEKEIMDKFSQLESLQNTSDDDIPECSKEERWATDDKYAVMKNSAKKALKLCNSKQEAEEYIASGKGDYIEFREGEDKKCMEYCSCKEYCSYWKGKYGKEII